MKSLIRFLMTSDQTTLKPFGKDTLNGNPIKTILLCYLLRLTCSIMPCSPLVISRQEESVVVSTEVAESLSAVPRASGLAPSSMAAWH